MSLEDKVRSAKFTVLLGKNGAGKSTMLRELDALASMNTNYISPERGGTLKFDSNVENNIINNANWLENTRRRNRSEQFREQSAVQFRNLELLVLREIEQEKRTDVSYTFERVLNQINSLLPVIMVIRSDRGFLLRSKTGDPIPEESISSGESELIALAIEVLVFARSAVTEKVLILDEPDVHLHPDLQHRFIGFIESIANDANMRIVVATHSTAIVAAFSASADLIVVPVESKNQTEFKSFKRSKICEEVLPIFGAHPLSGVFNKTPILLVEGEDDRRVVDQLVRSSGGRVKLAPCVVGSVSEMGEWEAWLNDFLPAVYDDPRGYSLRDLDDAPHSDINDVGFVVRARLNCYAVENFLLTDECIERHGHTVQTFLTALSSWLVQFPEHKFAAELDRLIRAFESRRTMKIKNVRNIIVAIFESNKPWEVIVGQLLAANANSDCATPNSINEYLGEKARRILFG